MFKYYNSKIKKNEAQAKFYTSGATLLSTIGIGLILDKTLFRGCNNSRVVKVDKKFDLNK